MRLRSRSGTASLPTDQQSRKELAGDKIASATLKKAGALIDIKTPDEILYQFSPRAACSRRRAARVGLKTPQEQKRVR